MYFIELTDRESADREDEWEKYKIYYQKSKNKKIDLS